MSTYQVHEMEQTVILNSASSGGGDSGSRDSVAGKQVSEHNSLAERRSVECCAEIDSGLETRCFLDHEKSGVEIQFPLQQEVAEDGDNEISGSGYDGLDRQNLTASVNDMSGKHSCMLSGLLS